MTTDIKLDLFHTETLKLKRIHPEAVLPTKAHSGDIGYDMVATHVEYDAEYGYFIYHTGWAAETNYGVGALLLARSSIRDKDALIPNGLGLIDTCIYRGEMCFTFRPTTDVFVVSQMAAMEGWIKMAWYRKILWGSYRNYFEQVHQYNIDHIMNWAPYAPGERIGQLVVFNHPDVKIEVVDELSDSDRGEGGYGSTGDSQLVLD